VALREDWVESLAGETEAGGGYGVEKFEDLEEEFLGDAG